MKILQEDFVKNIMKEIVGDKPLNQITDELNDMTNIKNTGKKYISTPIVPVLKLVNMYELIKGYNISNVSEFDTFLKKVPKDTIKIKIKNKSNILKKITFYKLVDYMTVKVFKSDNIDCKEYIKVSHPWEKIREIDTKNMMIKKDKKQSLFIHTLFGLNLLAVSDTILVKISYPSAYIRNINIKLTNGKHFKNDSGFANEISESILKSIFSYPVERVKIDSIKIETGFIELDKIIFEEVKKSMNNIIDSKIAVCKK